MEQQIIFKYGNNILTNKFTKAQELKKNGKLNDAIIILQEILSADPNHFNALHLLGLLQFQLGKKIEGIEFLKRAITINSKSSEAYNNLGNMFSRIKDFQKAIVFFKDAITLNPNNAKAYNNLGNAFFELKKYKNALENFKIAIKIKPDYAEPYYNIADTLFQDKNFSDAFVFYQKALNLNKFHNSALNGMAQCINKLLIWQQYPKIREVLKINIETNLVSPYSTLHFFDDPSLIKKSHEIYSQTILKDTVNTLWQGKIWRNQKIKLAYISVDFRPHPVAIVISEIFELHDRKQFELIAISLGPRDRSVVRDRLEKTFDAFYDIDVDKTDTEVAQLLYDLNIDIAIDLSGYTTGCRPGILAHRPTPIQINYLGFPATMGGLFMDYILADEICIPMEHQTYFTEKVVYLPDSFFPCDSLRPIAKNCTTRAGEGLPEDGFVFCNFNRYEKITPEIFDIWMRLLKNIKESVLWLGHSSAAIQKRLFEEAETRGISKTRIIFAECIEKNEEHLARLRLADLCLDTLPYNAHITTNDALWAGLPVLTCLGKTFPGRVAASQLKAIGLSELITHNLEEYEALAYKLATEPQTLAAIRRKLQQSRDTTPLFDSRRFVKNLEAAYRKMYDIQQRGEAPRSFVVPACL